MLARTGDLRRHQHDAGAREEGGMPIDETWEPLRIAVYRGFAETGRPPTVAALAATVRRPEAEVVGGLEALAEAHHLVLRDGAIVLAHPFASISFGFSVMGSRTLYWGGCAWDAFAIPHLVDAEPSALVATQCPACGTAHAWVVDRSGPPAGDQVVHFPTEAARVWDDVVRTCSRQRIFCRLDCVERWSASSGVPVGSVFDLATLWRLASRWYEGRLDSPYERRDPATAVAFFAEVGLPPTFYESLVQG
jgi:hypothetical protein